MPRISGNLLDTFTIGLFNPKDSSILLTVSNSGPKHPNGDTIIIPARPFLHPVMKYREQILRNYREAIRSAL